MVSQITLTCYFIFCFLRCGLPEYPINIDLKICMLRGIYTYKKGQKFPN